MRALSWKPMAQTHWSPNPRNPALVSVLSCTQDPIAIKISPKKSGMVLADRWAPWAEEEPPNALLKARLATPQPRTVRHTNIYIYVYTYIYIYMYSYLFIVV